MTRDDLPLSSPKLVARDRDDCSHAQARPKLVARDREDCPPRASGVLFGSRAKLTYRSAMKRVAVAWSSSLVPLLMVLTSGWGCASSGARVRDEQKASYDASFPVVWNAAREAVTAEYGVPERENSNSGYMMTRWVAVTPQEAKEAREKARLPESEPLVRVGAIVKRSDDGRGWNVFIQAKAGLRVGGKEIMVIDRGEVAEPDWVDQRIARLYKGFRARLAATKP